MKIKHLLKKLQDLDPEANVYFGESMESRPADYLLPGTRLRRDGYFMLTSEVQRLDESPGPTDRSLVDHILKRYGSKRSDLHGHDILISNWNGRNE